MSIPRLLRVLVTGATGMLGSHVVRALAEAGHDAIAFARSPGKAERILGQSIAEIRSGDVEDRSSVRRALQGCDAVIHCAAVVAVGVERDPRALIRANVAGVENVIGMALDEGLDRIVHVSSIAPLFRHDGRPVTEESEPQPSKQAYGQSKMLAELYARDLQAAGHPVKILYPGAIIGPDDPGLTESMRSVQIFIRTFLPVTTSGIQYVDVRDLATALTKMVEDTPRPGRYLAAGHYLDWTDLASLLTRVTGEPVPAYRVPAWALRLGGRLADTARRFTRIELPLSLESAMYVTRWTRIENSADFARLGVEFRPIEETMTDTVAWMRKASHL